MNAKPIKKFFAHAWYFAKKEAEWQNKTNEDTKYFCILLRVWFGVMCTFSIWFMLVCLAWSELYMPISMDFFKSVIVRSGFFIFFILLALTLCISAEHGYMDDEEGWSEDAKRRILFLKKIELLVLYIDPFYWCYRKIKK